MSLFFSNEDDDDFGQMSANSNLASLFQDSDTGPRPTAKSLVYTAPKQPVVVRQPNPKPQDGESRSDVIAVTAVTCYKLTTDRYEPLLGKVGLALLGDDQTKLYRMILYESKSKPVTTVKITAEFILRSKPNNFCTFYDDKGQNWAVLCDSSQVVQRLVEEIDNIKVKLRSEPSGSCPDGIREVPSKEKSDGAPGTIQETGQEGSSKTRIISRIAKLGQPILPLIGTVADENDSEQIVEPSPSPEALLPKPRTVARPVLSTRPTATPTADSQALTSALTSSFQFRPTATSHPLFPMMHYLPATACPEASSTGSSNHLDMLMSETRIQNSEIRMHLCRLTDKIDLLTQKCGSLNELPKHQETFQHESYSEVMGKLNRLQTHSENHSDQLDRVLKSVVLDQQTTRSVSGKILEAKLTFEKERNVLMASLKDADAEIQKLRMENARLASMLEASVKSNGRQEATMKKLEEDNLYLKSILENSVTNNASQEATVHLLETKPSWLAPPATKDDGTDELPELVGDSARLEASPTALTSGEHHKDVIIKELRDENDRLITALGHCKDQDNAVLELQEKLHAYQSKCAEIDSHLQQSKVLVSDRSELALKLQQRNEELERDCSHIRSVVETLQFQIDQQLTRDEEKEADTQTQVKNIMNKVYKEALRQFRPEHNYQLSSIKSILSTVIRDTTLAVLHKETPAMTVSEPSTPANVGVPDVHLESPDLKGTDVVEQQDRAMERGPAGMETLSETEKPNEEGVPSTTREGTAEKVPESIEQEMSADINGTSQRRPLSFLDSLHTSLAAAQSQNESPWRPEPPPPPVFDDSDADTDDWLA